MKIKFTSKNRGKQETAPTHPYSELLYENTALLHWEVIRYRHDLANEEQAKVSKRLIKLQGLLMQM